MSTLVSNEPTSSSCSMSCLPIVFLFLSWLVAPCPCSQLKVSCTSFPKQVFPLLCVHMERRQGAQRGMRTASAATAHPAWASLLVLPVDAAVAAALAFHVDVCEGSHNRPALHAACRSAQSDCCARNGEHLDDIGTARTARSIYPWGCRRQAGPCRLAPSQLRACRPITLLKCVTERSDRQHETLL